MKRSLEILFPKSKNELDLKESWEKLIEEREEVDQAVRYYLKAVKNDLGKSIKLDLANELNQELEDEKRSVQNVIRAICKNEDIKEEDVSFVHLSKLESRGVI